MRDLKKHLREHINRDAAELLYSNSFAGILITLFASSWLVFGFYNAPTAKLKLSLWSIVIIIIVVRMVDSFRWHLNRKKTYDYDGQKAIYRFVSGTLITALWWASYCLFVLPSTDTIELASMIIVVAAMAGGGASILAAHKITSMLYSFILLIPFSVGLVVSNQPYQHILGVLGLAFGLVMVFTARKSALFTHQAILLKNENSILVNQMELQVAQRTQKIYELSNLDPLTGLYNRTAFLSQLSTKIKDCEELQQLLVVIFIDLNGFKKINDTLGHDVGDQVLCQTASRLKNMQKDADILCRWGGDEFLYASAVQTSAQAISLAEALIASVSLAYEFDSNRLTLGATAGLAMYPEHEKSEKGLIQLADTAMYFQKNLDPGKAGMFSQSLGQKLYREQKLHNGLADAIEKNQLRLVYQPIVYANSHQVHLYEALLRWEFEGQAVAPLEFIKIAEQYGQIRLIGSWVLQQASLEAARWQQENDDSPAVSVNVSVIQLQDDEFIDIVAGALNTSGLHANKLHIEITESVFASDKNRLIRQIKILQSTGIKVSIDDFGTEYSSLSVMQDLAVNTVKIDRSFVEKLETSGFAIIKAVVQIANTLGYSVVAEGVETKEQANLLFNLGVDSLQGYYFAKPIEQRDLALSKQQSTTVEATQQ